MTVEGFDRWPNLRNDHKIPVVENPFRNFYKPLRAEICAGSTSSVALGSAWNCRVTRAATVLTARSEAICGHCVRALPGRVDGHRFARLGKRPRAFMCVARPPAVRAKGQCSRQI